MDEYKIEQYMKSKENFTIPEIQEKFHLEYGDLRRYFYNLQETKEIILKEGLFYYNYDVEEILDLYRTMLCECIKNHRYNKLTLKRHYRLDAEDISGFEDWLRANNYYDFINDEILITGDEFIKRFGKKEEPKEEEKEEVDPTFEELIRAIELSCKDKDENETDFDEDDEYEDDDEEELNDFDENGEFEDDDEPELEDNTSLKTCNDMLRQLLEGHCISSKEDFLSLVEQRLIIEENEMPIFLDIFKSVIEDVKKMTEVEFKSYLVRLLKD